MKKEINVLVINGSPQKKSSNTGSFVSGFLDNIEADGPKLNRRFISLGDLTVKPCIGCWNCTKEKPCPLASDDLKEIKEAMINCDMLILASPVYTNQVTAQMKAFFDRLFTWCHIFPLLGKTGFSVCTTGNDGYKETGDFLEKMLATYGVLSFGPIFGTGAFTSGFFPREESELKRLSKKAETIGKTLINNKLPKPGSWNLKMFKVMKRKLSGVHAIHHLCYGPSKELPDPSKFLLRFLESIIKKKGIESEQLEKLSKLMTFELRWWSNRNWLQIKSFGKLLSSPLPDNFNFKERLL